MRDLNVVEVEALVRWQHPQRGLVPPAEFIPLAEETGLIVPLGRRVLQEACRQAAAWKHTYGHRAPVMGVNLSARQFQGAELLDDVRAALEMTGLVPSALKLEMTESVVMRDAGAATAVLRALRELGVHLAIDDFGTGYSSLSYLKRFPVDTLKIDQSFVRGVGSEVEDEAIVRSVLGLARALGMSVTAEGVETERQRECLRRTGCALKPARRSWGKCQVGHGSAKPGSDRRCGHRRGANRTPRADRCQGLGMAFPTERVCRTMPSCDSGQV